MAKCLMMSQFLHSQHQKEANCRRSQGSKTSTYEATKLYPVCAYAISWFQYLVCSAMNIQGLSCWLMFAFHSSPMYSLLINYKLLSRSAVSLRAIGDSRSVVWTRISPHSCKLWWVNCCRVATSMSTTERPSSLFSLAKPSAFTIKLCPCAQDRLAQREQSGRWYPGASVGCQWKHLAFGDCSGGNFAQE